MEDGQRTAEQYDAAAIDYAAHNERSAFNAYYERPATQQLLGDVSGQRVLEIGCGSGPLTEWLTARAGRVIALDVSVGMLRVAQRRLSGRGAFVAADLAHPLPFADIPQFDLVVASLVFHYVRDWRIPLRELRTLLAPKGRVVFSTHHPMMDGLLHSPDDYFALKQVSETWPVGGKEMEVTFWRRPLTHMTEAIYEAGFTIEQLIEPDPLPELETRHAAEYAQLRTQPAFLFFVLRPA